MQWMYDEVQLLVTKVLKLFGTLIVSIVLGLEFAKAKNGTWSHKDNEWQPIDVYCCWLLVLWVLPMGD